MRLGTGRVAGHGVRNETRRRSNCNLETAGVGGVGGHGLQASVMINASRLFVRSLALALDMSLWGTSEGTETGHDRCSLRRVSRNPAHRIPRPLKDGEGCLDASPLGTDWCGGSRSATSQPGVRLRVGP